MPNVPNLPKALDILFTASTALVAISNISFMASLTPTVDIDLVIVSLRVFHLPAILSK